MLRVENLTKLYKNNVVAVDNVTLPFPERGMVFLLGKSGSGKSTLLNILGGIDAPSAGKIFFNGREVLSENVDQYRKKEVAFIFQDFQLLEGLSVAQNIELGREIVRKEVGEDEVSKLIESLDLSICRNNKICELSGGQMQRIAIARAIMKGSANIFADEPTGNLDSENSENVFKILKDLSKDKLVVVVTHDEESALKFAEYIVRLEDGKVVDSNLEQAQSAKPVVAEKKFEKEIVKSKSKPIKAKTASRLAIWAMDRQPFKLFMIAVLMTLFMTCASVFYSYMVSTQTKVVSYMYSKYAKSNIMYAREVNYFNKDANERSVVNIPESRLTELDENVVPFYSLKGARQKGGFWTTEYMAFMDAPETLGIKLLTGKFPSGQFEVLVPITFAKNALERGKYYVTLDTMNNQSGDFVNISEAEDLIGLPLYLENIYEVSFKIVGIFEDYSFLPDKYRDVDTNTILSEIDEFGSYNSGVLDKLLITGTNTKKTISRFQSASREFYLGGISASDITCKGNTSSAKTQVFNKKLNGISADIEAPRIGEVVISSALADKIGAKVGDDIRLLPGRVYKVSAISDYIEKVIYFNEKEKILDDEMIFSNLLFKVREGEGVAQRIDGIKNFYRARLGEDDVLDLKIGIGIADGAISNITGGEHTRFSVYLPLFILFALLTVGVSLLVLTLNFDNKLRAIGTIKAVGASKNDIGKIFLLQTVFIFAILFALGAIAGGMLIFGINTLMSKPYFMILQYTSGVFFVLLGVIAVAVGCSHKYFMSKIDKKTAFEITRNQ